MAQEKLKQAGGGIPMADFNLDHLNAQPGLKLRVRWLPV